MMTEPLPQKRPSASFFLNKSPEFQCYGFDLKVKDLIWKGSDLWKERTIPILKEKACLLTL